MIGASRIGNSAHAAADPSAARCVDRDCSADQAASRHAQRSSCFLRMCRARRAICLPGEHSVSAAVHVRPARRRSRSARSAGNRHASPFAVCLDAGRRRCGVLLPCENCTEVIPSRSCLRLRANSNNTRRHVVCVDPPWIALVLVVVEPQLITSKRIPFLDIAKFPKPIAVSSR